MKKLMVLCAMALVFGVAGTANSSLIDRGGGLIYDDVLDITWLQDANYAQTSGYDPDGIMNWDDAVAWADQLVYGGYDDWRLPHVFPVSGDNYNHNQSVDGSSDEGVNVSAPDSAYPGSTGSEMAYMYYNNLDNLGYMDVYGNRRESGGWGLHNTGPFINLQDYTYYWSGTSVVIDPPRAWHFNFKNGDQSRDLKNEFTYYAWAVRDGDSTSVVPLPPAIWLLGSGLIVFAGIRRKLRK